MFCPATGLLMKKVMGEPNPNIRNPSSTNANNRIGAVTAAVSRYSHLRHATPGAGTPGAGRGPARPSDSVQCRAPCFFLCFNQRSLTGIPNPGQTPVLALFRSLIAPCFLIPRGYNGISFGEIGCFVAQ